MNSFPPIVSRLIPSLGRENDHEVVTTVRAIGSALRNVGKDFHDLARLVETQGHHRPTSPTPRPRSPSSYSPPGGIGFSWIARHKAKEARSDQDRAAWLARYAELHLNEREQEFVRDLDRQLKRCGTYPTPKQAMWLDALFSRVTRWAA